MKSIIVGMDEVGISTQEQPIIGTIGLGPCVGVLIYSKKQKQSVVIHASTEWEPVIEEALIVLASNELISVDSFSKAVEILHLHKRYDLYNYDNEFKQKIIDSQGLTLTKIDPSDKLEATIIPGYYQDNYNVAINIAKYFVSLEPLFKFRTSILPKKAIRTCMLEDLGSHEFFFDSSTGRFVTDKIKDYIDINEYRL